MLNTSWYSVILMATAVSANLLADKATADACAAIANVIPGMLHLPGSKPYKTENGNYWSQAMKDTKPACIAMPVTAEGVSSVVNILNKQPTVRFAVKSGGHSPNADFASVQNGVLLSLANMKGALYNAELNLAYVSPGGKWKDVIGDLAPYQRTVVGGRLEIVGVGGYLTGGGLSFLSAQYGMVCWLNIHVLASNLMFDRLRIPLLTSRQ